MYVAYRINTYAADSGRIAPTAEDGSEVRLFLADPEQWKESTAPLMDDVTLAEAFVELWRNPDLPMTIHYCRASTASAVVLNSKKPAKSDNLKGGRRAGRE
jgi:hypothetical protein